MANPLKCDLCSKPATVHLTQILDNKVHKVDLCEACAQEKGVTDPSGFSLADLLLKASLNPDPAGQRPRHQQEPRAQHHDQRGGPPPHPVAPLRPAAQGALKARRQARHRAGGKLDFAFSPQIGYLTACPTNVGTGMRASAMMHLPALVLDDQITQIIKAVNKIGLAVRGLLARAPRRWAISSRFPTR
jgi:hypothetical protein